MEIFYDCTPKELNEVKFTMELWKKYAKVASFLNNLLDEGLLFLKVWLQLKILLATAIVMITFLALASLALQGNSEEEVAHRNNLWVSSVVQVSMS